MSTATPLEATQATQPALRAVTPPSTVLPPRMRLLVTVTLLAATFMEVVDTSIVNVALPSMQGKLGVTLDEASWVSTGYIISNVIVLPLTAWLSDALGRRRFLAACLILFTAASVGCGLSSTLPELVLFRVLQGAGGAAFLSTSQSTMLEIFPTEQRGAAQALFGVGVMMAPTLGPSIGGYLTDHYSWPWIFFVNVPVGIVATGLTLAVVPDSANAGARRAADFLGIGLLAMGLGSLQFVLERGEHYDWWDAPLIRALAASAVLGLALFLAWELHPRNKAPAVDVKLALDRNLALGSLYGALLGFLMYGSIFAVPQLLQSVQAHTAQQTGALLIPGGLATAVGMAVVGRLSGKLDARLLVGLGMLSFGASSCAFATRLTLETPDVDYFAPLILRGLGFGLSFVPLSLIALGTLRPQAVAQGAGLYNLFRQLGGSFGIATLTTLLDRRAHLHAARLADHVGVTDTATQLRLDAIARTLVAHGSNEVSARQGAVQLLAATVRRHAVLSAFIDVFCVLAAAAAVGVVGALLFRKPRNPGAASAAH
ncbi:MAG: DHA2 family efflux MFS transporter permease subunit [Deltaproteobacteria bacterium]|nr:DHA2 family efflux MFS transporter permease subunit [Deltaproteobacteria bacterium]